MQSRKKNPCDPLGNPVLFYKGAERKNKGILSLKKFEDKVKANSKMQKQLFGVDQAVKVDKLEDIPGKKFGRVAYSANWKGKIVQYDSDNNPKRDDYQELSYKYRPKETLFKELSLIHI